MLIYKYKKEIEELKKKLDKVEEYFNSEETNRIKKIKEINELNRLNDRYKQEIQELKEKLNDKDDTSEIKSNDDKKKEEETNADMPYLESQKETTERIADFQEKKESGHVNLTILLSKIYTNNSSKKLISDIELLINNLFGNKQIKHGQSTNVYDIYKNVS